MQSHHPDDARLIDIIDEYALARQNLGDPQEVRRLFLQADELLSRIIAPPDGTRVVTAAHAEQIFRQRGGNHNFESAFWHRCYRPRGLPPGGTFLDITKYRKPSIRE